MNPPALLVLGMHRSGTSALAGMLLAAGARVPGPAIRNWDNALGHHEALDLVRLNEAVLAGSGGHWLQEPSSLTWTSAQAAAREDLLRPVDGRPALLKDPRSLLTSVFWRERADALRPIGIIRHPLAVARSLASWRDTPLHDGLALWLAHNHRLRGWRDAGAPILDLDAPRPAFLTGVAAAIASSPGLDHQAPWREAFAEERLHHDGQGDGGDDDALTAARALYVDLGGNDDGAPRGFPWADLDRFAALVVADPARARTLGATLLARQSDAEAIAVPLAASARRAGAVDLLIDLLDGHPGLRPRFTALILGKASLDAQRPDQALVYLRRACAEADPDLQALLLVPEALRRGGCRAEARHALAGLTDRVLYPHTIHARLAAWAEADGDATTARADLEQAVVAAPRHRRGRLRGRLARLLRAAGDEAGAAEQIARAAEEDPAWTTRRD